MIKLIFLILLITSCSSVNVDTGAFGSVKNFILKDKITINDEFISSMSFSFISVTFKRNQAIFVLSSISDDGTYTWVGTNDESIKTWNGMIVDIHNFDPEFSILFNKNNNLKNSFFEIGNNFDLRVHLSKPDLKYLSLNYSRVEKSDDIKWPWNSRKNQQDYHSLVHYLKSNKDIGWNTIDSYYILNDMVIETSQSINPLYPPIHIEFYYKY